MSDLKLFKNFAWGGATAAYQAEGAWNVDGSGYSNWDHFSNMKDNPANINNVSGNDAVDFYHHYEEDLELFAKGGHNAFRFSLSWTRIISDETNEVLPEGIAFYNKVIDKCLELGLEPVVTLHHYDIPYKYEEAFGGWLDRRLIDPYLAYAKVCFEAFGDRVKNWTTLNEPKFYSYCGYVMGNWPPHKHKDLQSFWVTIYHQMIASAKAIALYKSMNLDGYIGIVHDHGTVQVSPKTKDKDYVYNHAELFHNKFVLDMCVLGKIPRQLEQFLQETGYDTSFINYDDEAILAQGTVDFLGINSYQRFYVTDSTGETVVTHNNRGKASKEKEAMKLKDWFDNTDAENVVRNNWGREIYPKAIYDGIVDVSTKYPGVPLFISENGHAVYDHPDENRYVEDDERIEVLSEFTNYVIQARQEGYDVQGYFVWSATDVWSWVNGYEKRYGLIRVDQEDNFRRIPKKSYYWYKALIEQHPMEL